MPGTEESDYRFSNERLELLEMLKEDQDIRKNGDFTKVETILTMARIDAKHQKRLKKIFQIIKLPTVENIGYDGAEAVWIIAQHAAYDLALMKKSLELFELAARDNPENTYYRGIPYLIDRIRVMEGKYQIYGTQFWSNPNGNIEPYPLKDPQNIDKLRKKYGLRPFSEYYKDMSQEQGVKRPVVRIHY